MYRCRGYEYQLVLMINLALLLLIALRSLQVCSRPIPFIQSFTNKQLSGIIESQSLADEVKEFHRFLGCEANLEYCLILRGGDKENTDATKITTKVETTDTVQQMFDDPNDLSVKKIDNVCWGKHFSATHIKRYQIIAAPGMEDMARKIAATNPNRFLYHETAWNKFLDGTDNIQIGGFQPINCISGENVLMLASFHNNDVTLSQFSVMVTLLQSFVESLTVVLPFYPVGTMERVIEEGQVATANTYAQMFSNLPTCGKPTRLVVYDLHTLQNRFYLHGNAIASLQTTVPLLIDHIKHHHHDDNATDKINCVAFPDDGAAKRFSSMFRDLGYEIVTCGKTRDGDKRVVSIQDGEPKGKHVIIVDDLVQTGGTLYECGLALKAAGAEQVSAFVAHAVFPNATWKRFAKNGDRCCFSRFYVSNSIPHTTSELPLDDVFVVIDLARKIIEDIDRFS